ncbi:MAG: hypothetical protein H6559_26985 [Lewinellaceae bacterium]|nr:hypothetical protein [Lewinellaceae bacterium]
MKYKITIAREAPEMPKFDQGDTRGYRMPGGGGYMWMLFLVAAVIIVATQIKKENPRLEVPNDQELFEKLPDNGKGVQKLFFEVAFFKKPEIFLPNPSGFDEDKRRLYISVLSGKDINQFSSELDKAIEKLKPQVEDFDFELFKYDILQFTESLKEAA